MKKLLTIISIFYLVFSIGLKASALSTSENIINNPSFVEKVKIRKFIFDITRYSNQKNLDKIKEFYSKDYKNTDDFSYDEYFEMFQDTFNTYSNLKYKISVKSIQKIKNGYKVTLKDSTTGFLKSENENFKYGLLSGKSAYELFLKNTENGLKIYKDNVLEEETSLTYGEANIVKMELITPDVIKQGEEYTIGLKVYPWTKSFIIASINNEKIVTPPESKEEVFRKLPKDGLLERIVTTNKNGKNEYATASVGFTRASLGDDNLSINFKMSGIGFLLKRINLEKNEERIWTQNL